MKRNVEKMFKSVLGVRLSAFTVNANRISLVLIVLINSSKRLACSV